MKIEAINGWVLIKPKKQKSQTESGIIIPESKTGHSTGVVISCSTHYYSKSAPNGNLLECPVKWGDTVLYRDYLKEIETIDIGDSPHCFIYVEDILCVVEESNV
jgi:co-chaperonin GroES (HSP10)